MGCEHPHCSVQQSPSVRQVMTQSASVLHASLSSEVSASMRGDLVGSSAGGAAVDGGNTGAAIDGAPLTVPELPFRHAPAAAKRNEPSARIHPGLLRIHPGLRVAFMPRPSMCRKSVDR